MVQYCKHCGMPIIISKTGGYYVHYIDTHSYKYKYCNQTIDYTYAEFDVERFREERLNILLSD